MPRIATKLVTRLSDEKGHERHFALQKMARFFADQKGDIARAKNIASNRVLSP